MKILVTGGLGFIGSHTTVELLQLGYDVVVVDNLSNSRISVLDAIEDICGKRPVFYELDLRDQSAIENLFENEKDIQGVIHFAAFKAVGESVEMPLAYYENNISALISLLQCMMAADIQNFIFSSSCTVYGEPSSLPISEDAPVQKAESPYGNTKKVGEEIVRDSAAVHELKAISLRYFNPVGAHQSSKIGELPSGIPQNLVPFVTQTAAGIRSELKVFGNDYPTPDGTAIRDYIHVVDLAKAHIKALERLIEMQADGGVFETFNIGTGAGNSVLEVINAFEKTTGVKVPYSFAPRRKGDIIQIFAHTNKATDILGWKAECSLDDMMRDAWNFQQALADPEHILNV
ncbi:MAG: UDP-glucose 4-epimerase GalE [Cryomorphaceae bacterium]|nr:UDP-glucose 4-epimerase GalE [Cryomorphaceae bacterium]